MSFCAICTASPAPHREPLGKNDALVSVCDGCTTQPARVVSGPHLGFRPSGGLLQPEEIERRMRAKMGDAEYERLRDIEERYSLKPAHARDEGEIEADRYWFDTCARWRGGINKAPTSRGVREPKAGRRG